MNTSTPKAIGFGLVGVGMIADFHAQAIAQLENARIVGVADRLPDRCRSFCERHHVPFSTTATDELMARPDVDIVCVTTPSGAHLEPALAAIRAGKHVVVEKPIEVTTERADEIVAAADAAGVRVLPIFQARFGDGARAVKIALDGGRFGRLVLATVQVKWHRARSYYTGWKGSLALDGGGAVINQAIHGVDLLQWFAGMPVEVCGYRTRRVHLGIEGEDTAAAVLKFGDGALGTIEASTAVYPGWSRRIEICGEQGSIALEDDRIVRWEFATARPEDETIRDAAKNNSLGSGASDPGAINFEGHRRQLQEFITALREGRPPPLDGREGRKALAIVRALYASAELGRPVKP